MRHEGRPHHRHAKSSSAAPGTIPFRCAWPVCPCAAVADLHLLLKRTKHLHHMLGLLHHMLGMLRHVLGLLYHMLGLLASRLLCIEGVFANWGWLALCA